MRKNYKRKRCSKNQITGYQSWRCFGPKR